DDQSRPVHSDQQWAPRACPTRMQSASHADGARDGKHSADHEGCALNPAQIAEGQQAERMPLDIEPLAGEHLEDVRDNEYPTTDHAAGGQCGCCVRMPRLCVRGSECEGVMRHRRAFQFAYPQSDWGRSNAGNNSGPNVVISTMRPPSMRRT